MDEVLGGYTETPGGNLLDLVVEQRHDAGAITIGLIGRRIFATLSRVGARAQLVHGDGNGLVRLRTQRAERHGAGDEALYQARRRFDLSEFERGTGGDDAQQVTQYGRFTFVTGAGVRRPRFCWSQSSCSLRARARCTDRQLQIARSLWLPVVRLGAFSATEANPSVVGKFGSFGFRSP